MDEMPPAGNANAQQPACAEANPAAPAAFSTEASMASGLAMLSAQMASMQKALADMRGALPQSVQAVPALPVPMSNSSGGANAPIALAQHNAFFEPAVNIYAGNSVENLHETQPTSMVPPAHGLTSLIADDVNAASGERPSTSGNRVSNKRKAAKGYVCYACGSADHFAQDKATDGRYICPNHASKSCQGKGRGKQILMSYLLPVTLTQPACTLPCLLMQAMP
jgi:hypothetical protein